MSRIIDPDSIGKSRNKATRYLLVAIRELFKQMEPTERSYDLVAFIILTLREISAGIDPSVDAWEKRGYWVKADRFRMEWQWTERCAMDLNNALIADDWGRIAQSLVFVAEKLKTVKVPVRSLGDTYYHGAYKALKDNKA